ncbi:MAG: winged helix-turn-helix domain-containing protein [Candidatus Hodarchaeota archaeon]
MTQEAYNQDEIFKSLSHEIRRNIIKAIGLEKQLPFSGIMKQIEGVDSPTLSYHLKSLQPLLVQKENQYSLSEIGKAAFNLLEKMDQSDRLKKIKQQFKYAFIATEVLWVITMSVFPSIIFNEMELWVRITLVIVVLTSLRVANNLIFRKLIKER